MVVLIVAWVMTLLGPPLLLGILMLIIRRGHIRVAKVRQRKVDKVVRGGQPPFVVVMVMLEIISWKICT